MTAEVLNDARERIESAAGKYPEFLREAEHFVYLYVKGMIRGYEGEDNFVMQFPKRRDGYMRGRPRMLAVEIIEGVRSALDYVLFGLSLRNEPTMNPKYPKFVIADDTAAVPRLGQSNRHRPNARQYLSLRLVAVAHHRSPAQGVSCVRVLLEKSVQLRLHRLGDNPPRALAYQVAEFVSKGWIAEGNNRIVGHGGASPLC